MQNIIILKYFTLRNQKGIAVLAWSEEFSIKNQHLDEQHKSFIQLLIETKKFRQKYFSQQSSRTRITNECCD